MATVKTTRNSLEEISRISELDLFKNVLYDMPLSCLHELVLRNVGDYCLCSNHDGFFLSVLVAEGGTENTKVVNLKLRKEKSDFSLYGFVRPSTDTLPRLLSRIDERSLATFSDVLDENIVFKKYITYPELETFGIYNAKEIHNKIVISRDYDYVTCRGIVKLEKAARRVIIMEPISVRLKKEFRKNVFDEMKMKLKFSGKVLPIRQPIAAVLDPPCFIFEDMCGQTLNHILDSYQHNLDLAQRINICASCVRIMSEIHQQNLFHGGVIASNFYANQLERKTNEIGNLEILLNGSDGLTEWGTTKRIQVFDYDICAPELAFTRNMTPESGVYNIGRLFEKILAPDLHPSKFKSPIAAEPEHLIRMRRLIQMSTRLNPVERPTMHGIVMEIRQILALMPPSDSKITVSHFNQFI